MHEVHFRILKAHLLPVYIFTIELGEAHNILFLQTFT